MGDTFLNKQLEELQMIQCSLMPGEDLVFLDDAKEAWQHRLEAHSAGSDSPVPLPASPAHFRISLSQSQCWIDVLVSAQYDGTIETSQYLTLDLKGDALGRTDQERWQKLFQDKLEELDDAEYPLYQLISTHILPPLHEELDSKGSEAQISVEEQPQEPPVIFHALLTSHHLISPNKRRSLQGWSSSLKIAGFAKVGYPGVIYGYGERENIEEFVANIKAMQWLALRVRFVEPLSSVDSQAPVERSWNEFQKVGEVVEEMRRLGREQYIIEMGIGSAGEKAH